MTRTHFSEWRNGVLKLGRVLMVYIFPIRYTSNMLFYYNIFSEAPHWSKQCCNKENVLEIILGNNLMEGVGCAPVAPPLNPSLVLKYISGTDTPSISSKVALRRMPLDLIDDTWTLIRYLIGTVREQAITWTNIYRDLWRHMTRPQ